MEKIICGRAPMLILHEVRISSFKRYFSVALLSVLLTLAISLGTSTPPVSATGKITPAHQVLAFPSQPAQIEAFSINLPMRKYSTGSFPPFELRENSLGQVWFSILGSNALGLLDPAANTLFIYYYPDSSGSLWWIDIDPLDRIWYATTGVIVAGAPSAQIDSVGYFDPDSEVFTEWSHPDFTELYGLQIDQSTGEVWFASRGNQPSIFRLDPDPNLVTDNLTRWRIGAYDYAQDLTLDASGKVWVSVPWIHHSLLRLDPNGTTNSLSAWQTPSDVHPPSQLQAGPSGEMWFSEWDVNTNNLARFTPTTNSLEEFPLPDPNSFPGGVALGGGQIWTNTSTTHSTVALSLSASANLIVITPQTYTPQVSSFRVDARQKNLPFPLPVTIGPPANTMLTGTVIEPFTSYDFPQDNCQPFDEFGDPNLFGISAALDGGYWLSTCAGIIKLGPPQIYLPLIVR